ncbi:ABC transporter substrate-binding protein [Natrinema ejinorense]|uniref:Nitrate ABC transporter substrate-binding protein n=1 Tax=Natrinema ejinorense TaxID=373386 RepID=A0A2A5QQE9_9EURY|nr:ABC transporter substrate-binding protein [Natrinema ejinorense]PCR89005.1 nitrate ABC transporter substrate-binding protein [Natrinema ejinorense]
MNMSETIRLFHLPFSFMLPQRVAIEKGYFAAEGLDATLVTRDRSSVDWKYIPADERLTQEYDVDIYPICKWESIKRTWEMDDGKVVANGTFSDLPYRVFVRPESDIETPGDLAGVPVGVNRRTGQEYTVMRALDPHVDDRDIVLEHHGLPIDRLRALQEGNVDAISLLEPQSALADRLGFRSVLEFENHIGIVGADTLDEHRLSAFLNAYGRAAKEINRNPSAYREAYLEMLFDDMKEEPNLFDGVSVEELAATIDVPRYKQPEPVDPDALASHLEWMKHHQLIDSNATVQEIVASSRT